MNISQAKHRFSIFGFFVSEAGTEQADAINLLGIGDMTETLTGEKKRGARGKPSNKVEKVDFSTTRTRVIACFEQISDPWLRYGWFIRRGMHRPTNYLRPRRARGPRIEYVQKSPRIARKSFANGSALINSPLALIESNFARWLSVLI